MHKVTFYLAESQISDLKALKDKLNISTGAMIRLAVNEYIQKNK
jgi:hypothetical protein